MIDLLNTSGQLSTIHSRYVRGVIRAEMSNYIVYAIDIKIT